MADIPKLLKLAQEFYFDLLALEHGGSRKYFDRKCYQRLVAGLEEANVQLTRSGKHFLECVLVERIRSRRVSEAGKEGMRKKLHRDAVLGLEFFWRDMAIDEAMKVQEFRSEPETLNALLAASSPEVVREICQTAYSTTTIPILRYDDHQGSFIEDSERENAVSNWPPGARMPEFSPSDDLIDEMPPSLEEALDKHAEAFIAAKNDRRYPKSIRPSSHLKRLWFLSVGLAGAVLGREVRTAIDDLGATRPDQRPRRGSQRKRKPR